MVKLVLYEEACCCTVTFESGRFRQDVWSKKSWEEAPKGVKTKKPTVLSQEQGQAVQNSIMSQYMGIDNSGGSGIMNIRNVSTRNMPNGLRTAPSHILTEEEISSLKKIF